MVARLEATARGFDARYIVTSLEGPPRHLYEGIYCTRGQAENLIKQHKVQLASDRTPCQSPITNQFRLVLHTAAYWLMLALRDAVPRSMDLAWSEFATIRRRLLKIGARVVEKAARVRIHLASACPDAALFRMLAGRLVASGPRPPGRRAPPTRDPSTPTPISTISCLGAPKAPNGGPCALEISR